MKANSRASYGYLSEQSLHSVRYLAAPILRALEDINAKHILDLGCGNGSITRILYENGYQLMGIDTSSSGIEHCRSLMPGATFLEASVYDDAEIIGSARFDTVIASEVIEHLYSPERLLRFASLALVENGFLLLTTPYHGYLKNLMLSIVNKWDSHWLSVLEGGHIKFWSVKTLTQLLSVSGFDVINIVGCGRLPYLWKSMLVIARKRADG